MSVEEPSPERFAECAEVVAEQLLIGGLAPQDVPLPTPSIDSAWLDKVEADIFGAAVSTNAVERIELRCEHGGFRLVRRLADDDASRVRAWLERTIGQKPFTARLRQLMAAIRSYVPIVPTHNSRRLH